MSDGLKDIAGVEQPFPAPELGADRVAAGKASAWSAVDVLGRQGVLLVVSIVLARLLTPADFGAVALTTFFAALIIAVVQQGLSTAVIQRHKAGNEELSSVFWWIVIASVAFGALLIALGPALVKFFNLRILAPLMIAAAAQAALSGLGSVHLALLTRDLRFADVAKASVPAALVSGLLGIGLAVSGAGVWALAAQVVSFAAVNSAALWLVSGWRPRMQLRGRGLGDTVRLARWVSLSAGLDVLYMQGFSVVLGRLYGPRDLGLYARAANTQQLPGNIVAGIIARVALPLFVRRKDEHAALRSGLLAANRMAMIINLPALVGLALTSDLVIRVLFGPQWDKAAPVLSILAWAGTIYPLHAINLQVLLATGRSDLFFRLEIAKKLVGVIAVLVGSYFGIIGLAWSQVAVAIIALAINVWPSGRLLGCGLAAQVADLKGIALATVLMAFAVMLCRTYLDLPVFLELGVTVLLGGIVFVAAGFAFGISAFHDVADLLPTRWNRVLRGIGRSAK